MVQNGKDWKTLTPFLTAIVHPFVTHRARIAFFFFSPFIFSRLFPLDVTDYIHV